MNDLRSSALARLALLGSLLLALAGCVVTEIDYDFDSLYDYGSLSTYGWVPPDAAEGIDPFVVSQVEKLVHQRMQATGYGLAKEPDFVVTMRGGRDRELAPADGVGRRQLVFSPGQGALVIEFLDAETREVFWRGSARRELGEDVSQKKRRDVVFGAVTKILRHFPAKSR
jgi:hypothetical protein